MRRELTATVLVALCLLAIVPAYDRVFTTAGWRGPAIVAAAGALLLAVLLHRVRRGPLLAAVLTIAGFVALSPWLLGMSARPVVPGPAALDSLWQLFELGRIELADTPAPTPPLAGLMLLVIGGWWMVAHTAHELAVRWRRPGLALGVLTVLWAAPLAVPIGDQTTWTRALPFLGMAGLTLLLTGNDETGGDERLPVPLNGVALGAVALVVALTMPGLLPGYTDPPWVELGSGASPRGYQPIVDVSQRLGLPEERDVLRVQASQRTYLRLAGLEHFDGNVWRLGPPGSGSYRPDPGSLFTADGPLPPEQPAANTESVQVDVEVLELENIYVPVPYQPTEILGPIREDMVWSTEGGFLATWNTIEGEVDGEPRVGISEGVQYRVQAARPVPTFEELLTSTIEEEVAERFTALPRDYPELGAQAEAVYDAAGAATTVERALALQDWFVGPGGFTYDLDVPALRGEDALTDFVLDDRVGYCEYFATAMAVMLRQTGIPARVATGFLPGRVTGEADPTAGIQLTEYTVSTADAHAWVEVLFPGAGWVMFEPTPRSDDSHILPTENDLTPIENVAERREREAEEADDDPTSEPATPDTPDLPAEEFRDPSASEDPAGGGTDTGAGGDGSGGWILLAIAAAGVGGFVVRFRRRRARRDPDRSPERRVLDAQRDLLTTAARHGVGRGEHETAVEVVERWRAERRIDERGVPVAVAAQAAAFGGSVDTAQADEVERLVGELEQMLRDSVSSRDRALAPLRLPLAGVDAIVRAAVARVVRWRAGG